MPCCKPACDIHPKTNCDTHCSCKEQQKRAES